MMCIDKDHGGELFWSGQAIDSVDLKTQDISAAGVPRNSLALAYVAEEMMFRPKGELLDGESDTLRFGSDGGRARNSKYKEE